jgi:DNA-binding NtrC family response regulator
MGHKLKILVLDDEEIVVTRLKPALEKEGYIVETFTNSKLAMEYLEKNRFDIVVTDLKMADIDGLQLFRFVKEKWPETKVVLISGFATLKVAQEAIKEGVYQVIPKPFKISRIKELIDSIEKESKF